MKYMLKRIFIGVSIGLILMLAKTKVYAASNYMYLYNMTNRVVEFTFDICENSSDTSMCINGFTKSLTASNQYPSGQTLIYTNPNRFVALKSVSMSFDTRNASDIKLYKYGNITGGNISSLFTQKDSNKLRANQFLSYVKITTTDNTICETTTAGASLGNASSTGYPIYPYFEVPTQCQNKYLSSIQFIFQSGYNYTGSSNIFNPIQYTSGDTKQQFINNNKNNTYLLSFDKKNIYYENSVGNLQLYFNSSYDYVGSTSPFINTYNATEQEINENLAQLEKEKYFASLGGTDLGPDNPSSGDYNKIDDKIINITAGIGTAMGGGDFNSFLSALVLKPIQELQFVIRNDNVSSDGETIACPTINVPFKVDHTTGVQIFGMTLPCMSNLYEQIPYVGISGDGGGATSWGFSVLRLWHIILMGYLYYLLVLTWVNLIKYTFTASKSEIEVVEL